MSVILGQWLRANRIARGVSQERLARLAGVRAETVARAEAGKSVGDLVAVRLVNALGLSVGDMLRPETRKIPNLPDRVKRFDGWQYDVSKALRDLRLRAGMTIRRLAKRAGLCPQTIYSAERDGKASVKTVQKLGRALRVKWRDLCSKSEPRILARCSQVTCPKCGYRIRFGRAK